MNSPERPTVGERLGAFLLQWESVTSNQFVLGIVSRLKVLAGIFKSSPTHRLLVTDLPRCAKKESALLSSLEELEQQEVVVWVLAGEIGRRFYSHVIVVRKLTGKFRLILNLKPLDRSVIYRKFCMDSVIPVKALLHDVHRLKRRLPVYYHRRAQSKVSQVGLKIREGDVPAAIPLS